MEKRWRAGLVEFLLLILGVSIALAAENWLNSQADTRRAESYILDVQADLIQDTVGLRV